MDILNDFIVSYSLKHLIKLFRFTSYRRIISYIKKMAMKNFHS